MRKVDVSARQILKVESRTKREVRAAFCLKLKRMSQAAIYIRPFFLSGIQNEILGDCKITM
jgi:hypothetical protein